MLNQKVKNTIKNKMAKTYEFKYLKYLKHKSIEENQILLESTQSRDFSGHVLYVCKDLAERYPQMQLVISIVPEKKDWLQLLLKKQNITDKVKVVEFLSKDYFLALATSKYLINDTTFWSFFNKRPEQVYINIWHGTPLKKLGKDMNLDGFGNVQKNFLASDYLVVSNDYTKEKLVESYNLNNIASTKVVVAPSARNSILFDDLVRERVRNELDLDNKKVYMYMPTYRDEGTSISYTEKALLALDKNLTDNEVLFVKLHPFDAEKMTLNIHDLKHVKSFPSKYETYEFLTAVDTLITDYSSIMYDFLCTNRSTILFTYDKVAYYKQRGLYEDIADYPFLKVSTIDELITHLRDDDELTDKNFQNKYISNDNLEGTKELVDYLFSGKACNNIKEFSLRNEKDNVVFFAGPLWDNGITQAFFNTLDAIDLEENNYILHLKDKSVKYAHKYKLKELQIPYILTSGVAQYSFFEGIFTHLYLKKEWFGNKFMRKTIETVVMKMYRLDFRRMFNNLEINHFIHYTGFERAYAAMTQAISGEKIKTTIFYHTDMFEEYDAKKNINKKVLKNSYEKVDQVVLVNEELRERLVSNYPKIKNIKILDNFLGTDKIIEASEESLFTSLLDTSITHYGGIKKTIHDSLPVQIKEDNSFTPIDRLFKTIIQRRNIGESDLIPNVKKYKSELDGIFQSKYTELFKVTDSLEITNEELGYIYGLSKLKLIDDLLDPNVKVFSNIGRFDKQKGHDRLLTAFEEVHKHHPNTRLVIIAPHGPLKNQTINQAKESSANEHIYIVGGMQNPYSLLKYCEAFVFTSLYEGLGLVVFESLAVNTNVITVEIPATSRGLQKGQPENAAPVAMVVKNDQESITKGWLDYLDNEQIFSPYDFDKVEQESLASWEDVIKPL